MLTVVPTTATTEGTPRWCSPDHTPTARPAPPEDGGDRRTPRRGADPDGDPARRGGAYRAARRRAGLRGVRPARGLGAGLERRARRDRRAHRADPARLG